MLDHKSCRAESDYTADVCRRQAFLVDRKGKMKWTRSPGSEVIPFSLSFTPPPPPFLFFATQADPCHLKGTNFLWPGVWMAKWRRIWDKREWDRRPFLSAHFIFPGPLPYKRLACHSDWSGARFIIRIITRILVHPSYRRVLAVPLIHHDRGDLAS